MYTPLWILDFLRDKVQSVPARVGEQGGVQSQGYVSQVMRRPLEETFKVFCITFKTEHMSNVKQAKCVKKLRALPFFIFCEQNLQMISSVTWKRLHQVYPKA